MRIRRRWPPLPSAPDRQSSTVHPVPSSQSRAVHRHNHLSIDHDLTPPCDFPIHSLRSAQQNQDPRLLSKTTNPDGDEKCSYSMHLGVSQDQKPSIGVGEDEGTAEGNTFIPPYQRMVFEASSSRLETSAGSYISSSLPHHQEHWCEEDKVIPIKKRRGSFKSEVDNAFVMAMEKEMWVEGRGKNGRKSGCKKKVVVGVDNNGDVVEKNINGAKKRAAGKSISSIREGKGREGWRCSRVNGRGWRCCQPTLVGYSLCEHHLSKGRLRSINSVRSKSTVTNIKCEKVNTNMCLEEDHHDNDENEAYNDDDDDDEKEGMVGAKKKKKRVGVVKARSLSSLLCQTLPSPAPPLAL